MLEVNGNVTTVAGSGTNGWLDGKGAEAQFDTPFSIAVNSKGEIYVGDRSKFVIRKIVFE